MILNQTFHLSLEILFQSIATNEPNKLKSWTVTEFATRCEFHVRIRVTPKFVYNRLGTNDFNRREDLLVKNAGVQSG